MMLASNFDAMSNTFVASLRSIGTAITMTLTGFYLHRTNNIGAEGKRSLAVIAQQVTIPLFLFTKIMYCNQDWSDKPCPDVTKTLADGWILLFWPIYVVGVGYLTGVMVAKATNAPKSQERSIIAACAFGNSTGLPITLLNVIHSNFPSTSDLGRVDPTLFLSVFLLLYPILLWGLGGYLLAPTDDDVSLSRIDVEASSLSNEQVLSEKDAFLGAAGLADTDRSHRDQSSVAVRLSNHQPRRLSSADESLYLSQR
jgi:predicted permease